MCTNEGETLSGMLQTLNGMRPGDLKGRYVIVCNEGKSRWRVGQLCTDRLASIRYVEGQVFDSEEEARRAVEFLRAV